MNKLKEWLDEQYLNLSTESTEVAIAQYKREGMLLATEIVMKKVAEMEDEDSIADSTQREVEEAKDSEA